MQRIEAFLNEEEVPEWASTLSQDAVDPANKGADNRGIGFVNASFEWKEASSDDIAPVRFHLGPLDVVFPQGSLTIVSGATGSGKSGLLVALLGGSLCSFFKRSVLEMMLMAF
jgi:ABC-type siderophore export system fused ATPase/permease subunit